MRLVIMGTGTFSEPTFAALLAGPHPVAGLVTQPDRPVGEERRSTRQIGHRLKTLAQEKNVPVFQPESINTPAGESILRQLTPDLLVVAAYGQILSKQVLMIPRHGGINVHASLLPKYRGAAPVAWAIYHGEKETGVTIIKMSAALDAGDILAQESIKILPEETAGELETRLAEVGRRLAVQVIDEIAAGTARGSKQDPTLVTKAPKLKKEDGLIDWTRHGRDICNQIRAMQPWPTAYTFWHRQGHPPVRLLITKANWRERSGNDVTPGDVVVDPENKEALVIAAEVGTAVDVIELQPAGKRRMPASEFVRGHRPQRGDRVGPEGAT